MICAKCEWIVRAPLDDKARRADHFGQILVPARQRVRVIAISADPLALIRSGSRIWNRVSCARPAAGAAPTSGRTFIGTSRPSRR